MPTLGRPSLRRAARQPRGPAGPDAARRSSWSTTGPTPGPLLADESWPFPLRVVRGWGRGPAAARNLGWRLTTTPWVAFLDDDVVLPAGWAHGLAGDLGRAAPDAGGRRRGASGCRCPRTVARPTGSARPRACESARWATADMAYRRAALLAVDGFDERFPRAYREDADLALRVQRAGWKLGTGLREVQHPVRPAGPAVSVRVQQGNADDALMRRLHGPRWRTRAATGRGMFRRHLAASAGLALAVLVAPAGGRSTAARVAAGAAGSAYLLHVADLARRRVAAGPRTPAETVTMTWTSAVLPVAAVWHRGRGWWRHRTAAAVADRTAGGAARPRRHPGARRALQRRPGGRRAGARRPRGDRPAAGHGPEGRRGHQPVGPRPRPAHRRRRSRPSTPRSRPGSARSAPGRSARTGPTRGAPAASRGPAWCAPPRAGWGCGREELRRHRRHRRRRRGRPGGGGALGAGAHAGDPRRGGRGCARGRPDLAGAVDIVLGWHRG